MNKFGSVAVLLGGDSHERSVSLRSGNAIFEALKRKGISARCIDTRNGFRKELVKNPPSIAFIALHGKGGEDGTIQKILEKLKICYVGSSPKASEQAFDKLQSKKIFDSLGIPTPSWSLITKKNWEKKWSLIEPPVFIKPLRDGSSIGIVLVESLDDLRKQVQKSLSEFSSILIEKKVEGREFTVGVLGGQALPVIELRPKNKFYDYQAKYTKGMTDYLVPAPINGTLEKKLRQIGTRVFEALGLRDFSRIDVMVDDDENPFVLEANSIPGFTELSLLPKAAAAAGITFDNLCLKIIEMAMKRKRFSR